MYRNLDAAKIVATAQALDQRVAERFSGSGLSRVSAELLAVASEAEAMSRWLARPHYLLRIGAGVGIAALLGVVGVAVASVHASTAFSSLSDLLQGLESAINEVVFIGIAVYFLLRMEAHVKRGRALAAIHVLRSLAHIIDMHQLTKDPERVMNPDAGTDTASSPKRTLTAFELTRYLDYCSELLAVISKIAALYVQHFNEAVTLSAVNDVEELTSGLSRKIWQKIMILDRVVVPGRASAGGDAIPGAD